MDLDKLTNGCGFAERSRKFCAQLILQDWAIYWAIFFVITRKEPGAQEAIKRKSVRVSFMALVKFEKIKYNYDASDLSKVVKVHMNFAAAPDCWSGR